MRHVLRRVLVAAASTLVWGAATLATTPAAAACLGTHRTITVDARSGTFFEGRERALGLRDKEVILTFDDGPVPGKTTRILDALADECVKATFFMSGRMAKAYPSIAARVTREGHTAANHTFDHANLASITSDAVRRTVEQGDRAIREATGLRTLPFFRYPYLARSARTDGVIRSAGLIAFGANIDSKDYKKVSPATVRQTVMARLRKQGKGIVLMHDIQGRTAQMLPALLDQLKSEGFKVVHMVPGGAAPVVADTVLARAEPQARGSAFEDRGGLGSVVAAAFKPGTPAAVLAREGRPNALDWLREDDGAASTRASTKPIGVVERMRARRDLRRSFQLSSTGWGAGPNDVPLLRLEKRR